MNANKILDDSDSEEGIKLDQIKIGMPEANEPFPRKPAQTRPLQATGVIDLSNQKAKVPSNAKLLNSRSLEVDLALRSNQIPDKLVAQALSAPKQIEKDYL